MKWRKYYLRKKEWNQKKKKKELQVEDVETVSDITSKIEKT